MILIVLQFQQMKKNHQNFQSFITIPPALDKKNTFSSTKMLKREEINFSAELNTCSSMTKPQLTHQNTLSAISLCSSRTFGSYRKKQNKSNVNTKLKLMLNNFEEEEKLQVLRRRALMKRQIYSSIQKLTETRSTRCQSPRPNSNSTSKMNQFRKLKLLGKGKFGNVYLVIHNKTGFIAALKIIKKTIWQTQKQEDNIMVMNQMTRQIKIQMFFNHPHLIKLYDVFSDELNIYMLMELGTDGQLFELLEKKQKFSEETTSIIIRQVAKGVEYMHKNCVIHRDLKLQNIVFTHGMTKICDFGWSVYCPKHFRTTICGTPLYLSPEILLGNKYSNKIDIWALGAMTHELVTSENAFQIKKQEDLARVIYQEFKMFNGSPQLKSFVNFILSKDPSKRPNVDLILCHPFIEKYSGLQTSEELCELIYDEK